MSGHVHTRERGQNSTQMDNYPHLKLSNVEHFNAALGLAVKLGEDALTSFKACFQRLERISANCNATTEIFPDCDPHSFYFRMYTADGKLDMDGGIILHGIGMTHSVELSPKNGAYWSVHT